MGQRCFGLKLKGVARQVLRRSLGLAAIFSANWPFVAFSPLPASVPAGPLWALPSP